MDFLRKRLSSALQSGERFAGTDIRYLAESGFWMNVGSVAISLFSLGLYIVFANFLSRETYGIYQYFLSASAIIGTLTLTGMNLAVTRAVAQGQDGSLIRAVRFQLTAGALPFIVGLAGCIYYVFAGNLMFAGAFFLIGTLMPLGNAFNTYTAYLTGKKSFARLTGYTFVQYVPYYALLAITAVIIPSALALLAVNLLATAVATFFIYTRIVKKDRPQGTAS
jgi:O-antigen/teichoic acid export membrane protein